MTDKIVSKSSTKEYKEGWDRVFGKEELSSEPWQETGQRCGWTDTGICAARIAKGCKWPVCVHKR